LIILGYKIAIPASYLVVSNIFHSIFAYQITKICNLSEYDLSINSM
jgi:hypothetical protein